MASRSRSGDLTHYGYVPAWAIFAFVCLPGTTVVLGIAYGAYCEQHTPRACVAADGTVVTRPRRWRLLLLQLVISFALAVALAFLDDEVNSLGDLMRIENIPAAVIYTLALFGITIVVRIMYRAYCEHRSTA